MRTSATSWCNVDSCLRDTRFQEIRQRISNLTRVPWENAEHLQVRKREPPSCLATPPYHLAAQVRKYEP